MVLAPFYNGFLSRTIARRIKALAPFFVAPFPADYWRDSLVFSPVRPTPQHDAKRRLAGVSRVLFSPRGESSLKVHRS